MSRDTGTGTALPLGHIAGAPLNPSLPFWSLSFNTPGALRDQAPALQARTLLWVTDLFKKLMKVREMLLEGTCIQNRPVIQGATLSMVPMVMTIQMTHSDGALRGAMPGVGRR